MRKRVAFKGEPTFYDDADAFDEVANGIQMVKHIKVSSSPAAALKNGHDDPGFGPHIIKMGQYDEEMLNRVATKYRQMGHSVQMKDTLIKLNVIKASSCLQEEVMEAFEGKMLEHTDMTLVASNEAGQAEIPCHKFVLAVRSPVFKRLLSGSSAEPGPLKEVIDASHDSLKAMVKYLYTDTLENQDINEEIMNLAEKYGLKQLKELCLPHFVRKISADNCLKAYIYGHLHNYEPLKFAAFETLDQHWERYETDKRSDMTELMKTHPNAVLEILNRLHKRKSGFLVRSPQINLKMVKAFECLQEEMIKSFPRLEHTDMTLVSSTGQEIPCHRFVLGVRSRNFQAMFAGQEKPVGEALKIHVDASTKSVEALIKYLYTDALENNDITEDLIALSEKYNLDQLKTYCMPTFIENVNAKNCLQMYVYGYRHNFDQLKTTAFKTLDDNWKQYASSNEFPEMMKNYPNAVLEIMSRLHKANDCQPIVLENVKPRLVDF